MEDWFFMPDFQFRINCQIQMKFEGAFFVGDRFIKIHLLENTTCMCKCGVWEVSEVHKSLLSFKTRLLHSVLLHFCWFTELADCNIQNPHSVSSRNMTEGVYSRKYFIQLCTEFVHHHCIAMLFSFKEL